MPKDPSSIDPSSIDPNRMIRIAKALQRAANRLAKDSRPTTGTVRVDPAAVRPDFDESEFYAYPILLSLAMEIALKAWQCRERKGAPDRGHDLLELFRDLKPDTQETLENLMTSFQSLSSILRANRDTFERWRYLYEHRFGRFDTGQIDQALMAIINGYENPQNE